MRKSENRENFDLDISRGDSAKIEEIVVCPLCKGYGTWNTNHIGLLKYNIENPTLEDTCDKCDGTGRLVRVSKIKFRAMSSKKALKTQIVRNPENVI